MLTIDKIRQNHIYTFTTSDVHHPTMIDGDVIKLMIYDYVCLLK